MNNPQTDQDLYHDPEALSPTLFSDNYDISRKESHPKLTFFTKNEYGRHVSDPASPGSCEIRVNRKESRFGRSRLRVHRRKTRFRGAVIGFG